MAKQAMRKWRRWQQLLLEELLKPIEHGSDAGANRRIAFLGRDRALSKRLLDHVVAAAPE